MRRDGFKVFQGNAEFRLQDRINALFMACFQKLFDKLAIKQGVAPGHGHSAFVPVEGRIPPDFLHDVFNGHPLAGDGKRVLETGANAIVRFALVAFFSVMQRKAELFNIRRVVVGRHGVVRANLCAAHAADAFHFCIEEFRNGLLPFGI